jgi:integrase
MLTHDNLLLSRPKTALEDEQSQLPQEVSDTVRKYVSQSLSENTRRAYRADLDHFIAWGGSIPCPAETLAEYLAAHADKLAPATLVRRIASIGKAHAAMSKPNPAETELVRATIRGIKRNRSKAQTQAKPLLKEDLFAVLQAMGEDIHATRDKALLLIGFASAMRRSELVALNVEHIRTRPAGSDPDRATQQDGPRGSWPKDRHPVRKNSVVSSECTERLAFSFRHQRWTNFPTCLQTWPHLSRPAQQRVSYHHTPTPSRSCRV